jgi:ATP-dependent RNA helicase DDX51/DBP6
MHRPYDSYLLGPLEDLSIGNGGTAPHVPKVPQNEFKTDYDEPKHSSCQKLLFSATLTSDPGKIASLGLRDPKYFVVRGTTTDVVGSHHVLSESFSIPTNLTVGLLLYSPAMVFLNGSVKEHMVVCNSSQKPLILFYLARVRGVDNALVFTKSAESTARLVKLFELFEKNSLMTGDQKLIIRAYSSDLPPSERKSILEQLKEKKIDV